MEHSATKIRQLALFSNLLHHFILLSFLTSTFRPKENKRGWDKSPSLSIVFGLSSKTQWLSGLYYADFISFYSPTQLSGGGTTKSNSNELPISVPLSLLFFSKDESFFIKFYSQLILPIFILNDVT